MDTKIKAALIDIVGAENFTDDLIDMVSYSYDGSQHKHRPACAVWPDTSQHVSEILMLANVEIVPVRNCRNVIAWIEGKNPNKIIVVGAHLDHIGVKGGRIYNGADDNASGSAAVLGLARRFSKEKKPNYTIIFQWYTGEERGFLGSKHYVKNPKWDIEKHIFMLNLDMIGRLEEFRSQIPVDVSVILSELYQKYSFAKNITFREDSGSDHVVFARYMPVIFLHTGTHRDYHRTSDDADKINYEGMVQVCNYAYDFINKILGDPEVEVDDYILFDLPIYNGKP